MILALLSNFDTEAITANFYQCNDWHSCAGGRSNGLSVLIIDYWSVNIGSLAQLMG